MSSEIKIESGIPLPKRASKIPLPNGLDKALGLMNVGQSFKVKAKPENLDRVLNALRMKVQRHQRNNLGYRFSVITETPESIRIFRVEAD
jgi:hypothetical protein